MTRGCEWKAAGHGNLFKDIRIGLSLMDVTSLHERTSIRCSMHQSKILKWQTEHAAGYLAAWRFKEFCPYCHSKNIDIVAVHRETCCVQAVLWQATIIDYL